MGRSWSEALGAEQELRDQWAEAIWRFAYGSYARFGMINVDPHPGNYVFHDDGSVSFLDFGCVQRLRRDQANMVRAILRECVRGDVLGTWRACVEIGYWRSSDPVTPEEVFAWWHEPLRYLWAEQPFTITPEYATSWIEHRFSPTGHSANALRYLTCSATAWRGLGSRWRCRPCWPGCMPRTTGRPSLPSTTAPRRSPRWASSTTRSSLNARCRPCLSELLEVIWGRRLHVLEEVAVMRTPGIGL